MSGPLLITGASGAIGTRLAADLAAHGIPLRLLDRRPPADGPPAGAEFVQADLRDEDAVEKAAAGACAVIHLAGITQEGKFAEMVEHNITGTHHVLEAARRQRVPRVVLASSHHVTGLNPVGGPVPLAPDSFYAVSKVTLEALGHLYATRAASRSSPYASAATAPSPANPATGRPGSAPATPPPCCTPRPLAIKQATAAIAPASTNTEGQEEAPPAPTKQNDVAHVLRVLPTLVVNSCS